MSYKTETPSSALPATPVNGTAVGIGSSELVLLRDWHLEKSRVLTSHADDCRRDLDRMIADGSGPRLFPGRWPETIEFNRRQITFERDKADEHTRFAATAEAARLALQNIQ